MNSIVDTIFVDNLHIMFGPDYLMNTVNTIFKDMSPEYKVVMNQRLYSEINSDNPDNSPMVNKQKELMVDYLSNLLGEFFDKMKKNISKGGGINKLEEVKNHIRKNIANIKPKFYT